MDLTFNHFIIFFFSIAFTLSIVKQWRRSKELDTIHKLPPGPWKLPFIGNLHNLMGSPPHHVLRNLAQKHGGLMHLKLGEISAIVVSSPCMAKAIMRTHDLEFANRAEFVASRIVAYNCSNIACSPYGDYWRQMRKICTLELLTPKVVQSFASIRQDEALQLIASIKAHEPAGEPVNLTQRMYSYTSSVVCRAAFGKIEKEHRITFSQQLQEGLVLASAFDICDLFPSCKALHIPFSLAKTKFMKMHKKVDAIFDNMISEHVGNLRKTDSGVGEDNHESLFDVLLRVQQSGDLPLPITNNNIKAVLLDIFAGGTDTSSTTVEWAMSEMIRNANVMAKAQSEIRTALMGKTTIEESDIQNLRYLKLVIKETLRLHPPVPLLVPRECRERCEIDGYIIPIKTRVLVNVWAIGRDPQFWSDPDSFKPERFENTSVDFTGNHFEFLPFGAGKRMCPGMLFGIANVELPLALLLYHFDWKLPNGLSSNDLDMREALGIVATRKINLCLLATSYISSCC